MDREVESTAYLDGRIEGKASYGKRLTCPLVPCFVDAAWRDPRSTMHDKVSYHAWRGEISA